MNIYMIERTDDIGWDEYESWVVSAHSHRQAYGLVGLIYNTADITFLGVAGRDYTNLDPQIIHSSFNAA